MLIMRMIPIALLFGALSFAGIVVMLYFVGSQPSRQGGPGPPLQTLTIIHFVVALIIYPFALFLHDRLIRSRRVLFEGLKGNLSPAEQYVERIRVADIIRYALFECVSFFGLIVCMLAVLSGVLREEPVYWVNGLSTVVFAALIAFTFPSRERLKRIFTESSRFPLPLPKCSADQ
jgi:hypothetical protein